MKPVSEETYPKIFLYRRLVQAKLFIDAHYAEPIDLANIADEACMSRFHFIRRFKEIYRKTPHQYLITVRLGKAKELLKGGMAVSAVCLAVGFESLSSFSGLYKRVHGVSPSVYLKEQQDVLSQVRETPLRFIPACFAGKNGWL